MSNYTPDRWVIIKITSAEGKTHYRVFGSWYGGYAGSDIWQMNSGITKVRTIGNQYVFEGRSGSEYFCTFSGYGVSGYGAGVLDHYGKKFEALGGQLEILPESTNWNELNYE